MKNILIIIVLLGINLVAKDSEDKNVRNYNSEHLEQFFYKKGLKDGAEKGYKDGYRDGIRLAKKQLRLWSTKIKALEEGKYLKEYRGKITNPAVYQIKSGNEIKVIVRGCRIDKQLTADEIIDLPHYPIDGNGNKSFKYYNIDETALSPFDDTIATNSADIIERDGNGFNAGRPSNPYTNNSSYYYLENSRAMRKKLDVLNYSYAIEDDKLKVIFDSKKEKDSFLQHMGF